MDKCVVNGLFAVVPTINQVAPLKHTHIQGIGCSLSSYYFTMAERPVLYCQRPLRCQTCQICTAFKFISCAKEQG